MIEQSTGIEKLSLHEADQWIQKGLKELIGDLQGLQVASQADLRVVDDKEFEDLLIKREPPKTDQDMMQHKMTMGFVQEDSSNDLRIVWIRKSRFNSMVLTHEGIHLYAHSDWKAWKRKAEAGQALDEGTTEYFARKIAELLSLKGDRGYDKWVVAIQHVIALTSESLLAAAYFSGKVQEWYQVFLQKGFNGNELDFYDWSVLVKAQQVEQAKLKLSGSLPETSVNKPSGLALLISNHVRLSLETVATGGSITSKGIQTWDLLVAQTAAQAHPGFSGRCGKQAVLGVAQLFARLLEPTAPKDKTLSDEEDAVQALVNATSWRLVVRAFLLGEIDPLEKAHSDVEYWIECMNRDLGVYTAAGLFKA